MSETASRPASSAAWHDARGALRSDVEGRETVMSYGDPVAEVAALRSSCGLVERSWSEGIEVTGEDRVRFLNGYLTCEVSAQEGTFGFFTSARGGILADARVSPVGDGIRLVVPAGRAEPLIEHLSRYVIADRVELKAEDRARWLLAGPAAEQVLGRMGMAPPAVGATVVGDVAQVPLLVTGEHALDVPVFGLAADHEGATAVAEAALEAGASAAGFDAFEALRIAAAVPRYGVDFSERHFPQETGIDDAVSYTKGCYLGQEVVARIHYRGHVNHSLRVLEFEVGAVPVAGSPVNFEGDEVGRLGSVTTLDRDGAATALAIVHRKAAAGGTEVEVGKGLPARVVEPVAS